MSSSETNEQGGSESAASSSGCSSSQELLFTYDEAKDVIRLGDGSEIPGQIVDSIDVQYPDEPANEYQEWKPVAVDAVIHIKDGWLWGKKAVVYASDYIVRRTLAITGHVERINHAKRV